MTHASHDAVGGAGEAGCEFAPVVTIRPDAGSWRGMIASRGLDDAARLFRHELGLPVDQPVIMSGHQSQIWHPGIVAKLLALDAAAGKLGASAAWVVVDHDDNDPLSIRAPYVDDDGRLGVASFAPPPIAQADVPACRRPAWAPGGLWSFPAGGREAAPGVTEGLGAIHKAMARHAGAGDAASQATAAAMDLLPQRVARPQIVNATALSRTTLFGALIGRMREDPRGCIESHNAAVAEFPRERIAPLAGDTGRLELPLWTIGPGMGSPRQRVIAADLDRLPIESLAPRALLLTGLMRLAGCELFIHGVGGERYDRITERWLGTWLGKKLAPTTLVTATMRLRIPGDWSTTDEIALAVWRAHHAKHDPSLLGDGDRAEAKQEMLRQIDAAPLKSRERAELYRALHAMLGEAVAEHRSSLESLESEAAALQMRAGEATIAGDRTWAFPLYAFDQIAGLRNEIAQRFSGA